MLGKQMTYTSFTQKYKKLEDLSTLTDLNLTPAEGFELKQLFDLNELSDHLPFLIRIDVSNNYLSQLILKNFLKLQNLYASQNMISECQLLLPKLRKLDLSTNLLKEIPNLTALPELVELNLSKNLIEHVNINDLSPIVKTLEILELSFNKINFEGVNEFISFIDGMKLFNLKSFSIHGNKFIEKNKIIANSYKTLLLLSMPTLTKLNGEQRIISDDLVNEDEIKQQMLFEQEYENQKIKKYYSKFSEYYTDKDSYSSMVDLNLTPLESFLLKDISDINEDGQLFNKLISLNLSSGLLTSLVLGDNGEDNFINLRTLKASQNKIEEVQLTGLPSLRELDLSNNNLQEIPNLKEVKGDIRVLILKSNKIREIDFEHFNNLKRLKKLNLAGNKITFGDKDQETVIDREIGRNFMAFPEIMTINLEDNPYMTNPKLYSFFLERMRIYLRPENREIFLNGNLLKPHLEGEEDNENIGKGEEVPHSEDHDYIISTYEEKFSSVNNTLERLIAYNGENQALYFEFLDGVNEILEVDSSVEESCNLKSIYEKFLLNCNEFLHLNSNYEKQIIKTLAQFALIQQLNVCKQTIDFFKIYIGEDENKKNEVQSALEEIVLKHMKFNINLTFEIISKLIGFFKDANISSSVLYKNMILRIVDFMSMFNEGNEGQKCKDEKATDFLNSANFIIEYFKEVSKTKPEPKVNYAAAPFEGEEEKEESEEDSCNSNSAISEDFPVDKTDYVEIYDYAFMEKITKFESKANTLLNKDFNKNANSNVKVKQTCLFYETLLSASTGKDIKNLFGNTLLETIANDNSLLKIQYLSDEEKKEFEELTYIYIFSNVFRSCYIFLSDITSYFTGYNEINAEYTVQSKKFFLMIELLTNLLDTYDESKFKTDHIAILKGVDVLKIIHSLNEILGRIFDNVAMNNNYEKQITQSIFKIMNPQSNMNALVADFLGKVPIIMNCIGALIAFLSEPEFLRVSESDLLDKFYSLINSQKCSPSILSGACNLMTHLLNSTVFATNNLVASKIITKSNYFKKLLDYINYQKEEYRLMIDTFMRGDETRTKEQMDNPYDFSLLNSEKVFEFFSSVINIFLSISKHSEGLKQIQYMIDELRAAMLYDVLSNCLQIVHSDEVRFKAIECFYHFDHRTLSNDIIKLIISKVSKYTDISAGDTEDIISIIYLTLNKKLTYLINTTSGALNAMKLPVSAALNFLIMNNDRNPNESEELEQKNNLTLTLIMFLITASRVPELYSQIFEENNFMTSYGIFKKIILLDYTNLNEESYIPIEIERTYLGMYSIMLFEVMEGFNTVMPYSYPFLRLMMKYADVLSGCDDYTYNTTEEVSLDELLENVKDQCIERFIEKVTNETKNWFVFSTNTMWQCKKELLGICSTCLEDKKFLFSFADKDYENIPNELDYKGIPESSEDTRSILPKPSLKEIITEQINFVVYFPMLFDFILGKKSNLSSTSIYTDMSRKFNREIESSDKVLSIFTDYKTHGSIPTLIGNIKHYDNEVPFSSPISKITISKLKTKNLESYLKSSNLICYTRTNEAVSSQNAIEGELVFYSLYGIDKKATRRARDESVNNPHLRSLIIASFLRCIYSVLLSPSFEIKRDFIKSLFIDGKYKDLLLLVSTMKYYNNFHFYHIINEIFNVKNITHIIDACSYNPFKENQKTDKYKNLADKIFATKNDSGGNERRTSMEISIFHQLYITVIYIQTEIIRNKLDGSNNFLFMMTFERMVYNFLNVYMQISFTTIDEYFRKNFILKKLCNEDHYNLIFALTEQLTNYSVSSFNLLKDIKRRYVRLSAQLTSQGIGEMPAFDKTIREKESHLIKFIYAVANESSRINELLAMLAVLDSKSEHEICYTLLDLIHERRKLQEKFEKKETNTPTLKDPKKLSQINEFFLAIKGVNFKKRLLSEIKEDGVVVLLTYLCYYDNTDSSLTLSKFSFKQDVMIEHFFVMTNKSIMLLSYDKEKKEIGTVEYELPIEDIESVIKYDYSRRLIIVSKSTNIKFSLLFRSANSCLNIISSLREENKEITFYSSYNLVKKITSQENEDQKIIGMIALKKEIVNTNEMITKAKMMFKSTFKNVFDQVKNLRTENELEQNSEKRFIGKDEVVGNIFLINSGSILVYFSRFAFYVIRENKNLILSDYKYYNDEVEMSQEIWKVDHIVYYDEITEIENNFETKTIIVNSKGYKGTFIFEDVKEMYLANVHLVSLEEYSLIKYLKKKGMNNKK